MLNECDLCKKLIFIGSQVAEPIYQVWANTNFEIRPICLIIPTKPIKLRPDLPPMPTVFTLIIPNPDDINKNPLPFNMEK